MTFKNFQVTIRCFRSWDWPFIAFGCFLSCGIFLYFKFYFFKNSFVCFQLYVFGIWKLCILFLFQKKSMASCLGEESVPNSWILDSLLYFVLIVSLPNFLYIDLNLNPSYGTEGFLFVVCFCLLRQGLSLSPSLAVYGPPSPAFHVLDDRFWECHTVWGSHQLHLYLL